MRISPETHVAGVQLVRIARALRDLHEAWQGFSWEGKPLARMLHLPFEMGLPLCLELEERGWLVRHPDLQGELYWKLSARGLDLIAARVGKPIRRTTAIKNLSAFLERVLVVERSRGWPLRVATIEVFGDFLGSEDRIMDVELVVDLEPRDEDDAGKYSRPGSRFQTQRDELWAYLTGGSRVLTLYQNPHEGWTSPYELLYMRSDKSLPLFGAAAKKCFPLEGLSSMSWDEYYPPKENKGA